MALRDVNSTVAGAIRAQLDAAPAEDRAAWLLALRLADVYEATGDSRDAALLLTALDALLATPKARRAAAPKPGTEAPNVGSALAKLRAAHGS